MTHQHDSPPSGAKMSSDRDLLFGILAFQLNFIDRQALLAAFDAWTADKGRSLCEILVELGKLDQARQELLEALVREHLKQHDNDPEKSLAAVSSIGSVRDDLRRLGDPEVDATLAHVAANRDGFSRSDPASRSDSVSRPDPASRSDSIDHYATQPLSAGRSSSSGTRFRILRPHARGGLGEVHVAEDVELHREVALKEIQGRHADDSASRARFVLEAEITGGLEHPGIVPVYGLGNYADGRPFYAMRFIKGDSLKEEIERFHGRKGSQEPEVRSQESGGNKGRGEKGKKGGGEHSPSRLPTSVNPQSAIRGPQSFLSLEFRKLLGRFIDVCNAVEYAHSRGVLHRDLKPGNIMLGKYGETLVVDWGLAKLIGRKESAFHGEERALQPTAASGSAPTQMGSAIGTPQYMSPEQAEGRLDELGPASDVYSLGATLYSLLTGRAAFDGAELAGVLGRVVKGDFPPPRQVDRGIPRALDAICVKAMATRPSDRYPSPRFLADDVEHWLADEAVMAARETAGERLARWGRKHRTLVRAGVAAVIVVAAVSGVALVVVDRARRATASALVAETEAKGREAEQRSLAEKRKDLAEANEKQAIDAVKRFRDAVANNPDLKNNLQLEPLRRTLLKEPLAFFKDLRDRLQADDDTRSESLARLAGASVDLGLLISEIGDKQDALVAHNESLAIMRKLADGNPTVTEYRRDLARCYYNVGNVLDETGKPAEALAAYEFGLALQQKLADDNPTVNQYRSDLALSRKSIGKVLSETGKLAEALAAYESALALQQKLADDNPTVNQYRSDLALSRKSIGRVLSETGKLAEALAAYESALAIQQKLADHNPTVNQYRNDLALSRNSIGNVLSETGKLTEALAAYESALALQQKLADDNPSATDFQIDLTHTHYNIGIVLHATGKSAEALAAYESALAIAQKLADDNPTVTQFQSALALSHNNIGVVLRQTGKPAQAIAAYESALEIQQKLADDNPTITDYQSELARSHYNIGILLRTTGKPAEALVSFESALALQQKLADDNPTIIDYQSDLAASRSYVAVLLDDTGKPAEALAAYRAVLPILQMLADDNPTVTDFQERLARIHASIGLLLSNGGMPAEAIAAYQSALAIQQKLTDDNPTVTQYWSSLALSHNNIGIVLNETGRPAEALAAWESALAIREHLARENPDSPDFASDSGATLNNMAINHLRAKRFAEARVRLRQAVEWQRRALAVSPAHPDYRQFLTIHLNNLIKAGRGLGDAEGVAEAERELAELRDSDPAFADLDARLAGIVKGDQQPANEAERLALAQRAYEKAHFATAERLWVEAFEANPALADNRQTQHQYNAACCAALAAAGTGRDDPPPDDAAKAKFRRQALDWLKAELVAWSGVLASADEPHRGLVARTLEHWQQDTDLAGIRDGDALAKLPDDERDALAELWSDVASLRQRAEAPSAGKREPGRVE